MNEKSELPYPEWQIPAQEVLLETNREQLSRRVQEAEAKISERLQQLQQSRDGHHERDAINHALSLVQNIKRERLASY